MTACQRESAHHNSSAFPAPHTLHNTTHKHIPTNFYICSLHHLQQCTKTGSLDSTWPACMTEFLVYYRIYKVYSMLASLLHQVDLKELVMTKAGWYDTLLCVQVQLLTEDRRRCKDWSRRQADHWCVRVFCASVRRTDQFVIQNENPKTQHQGDKQNKDHFTSVVIQFQEYVW